MSSNGLKVTSNEQKETSNEQKVTINEQKVTSNEQKVTSNEQKAKSSASEKFECIALDKKHASIELLSFWILKISFIEENVEHSQTERLKNCY